MRLLATVALFILKIWGAWMLYQIGNLGLFLGWLVICVLAIWFVNNEEPIQ